MDDYKLIEEQLSAISQRLERIETSLTENNAQNIRAAAKLEDIEKRVAHLQENDAILFNENKVLREQSVPKQDVNLMFEKIRMMENLPRDRNDKIVKWAVRIFIGALGTVLTGGLVTMFIKLSALLK
jgi:chromosome segregation ATPase